MVAKQSILHGSIVILGLAFSCVSPVYAADVDIGDESMGSILVGESCAATEGQIHSFIQPIFPSSGRGWSQKLIFLAIRAAGAGKMNSSHLMKFGHNVVPFGEGKEKTAEWLFSHEGDEEMDHKMESVLLYPERPQVVLRIVRNPLDNIEANFRYVKREGSVIDWDNYAEDSLVRYAKFHKYWDNQCKGDGHRSRCCITITYEDMQSVPLLRRTLKQLLKTWLSPILTNEQMNEGIQSAVTAAPPGHTVKRRYSSGKRYRASHYVTLSSALQKD